MLFNFIWQNKPDKIKREVLVQDYEAGGIIMIDTSIVNCTTALKVTWIREMFYLTMHSTHFIYGYMASDIWSSHSDSEKGNPLPPHRLLLWINSKGSFICTIPQTG